MSKFLDIDYLKQNKQRLYYFGLGFVQLVLNKYERVHFYNENITAPNDEVHNHRYNFSSHILKGCFANELYKLVPGDSHVLINESCNKNKKLEHNIQIPVGLELISTDVYLSGQSYHVFFNDLHSVTYKGNTITHLQRSDIITDYAQVIYPKDRAITCPFENDYTENQLWDIIKETIEK